MANEKNLVKDEIIKSIRDLLSLKVTLPLGNPDLKLVHTNQFCKTELPEEFMLENFSVIEKSLSSKYNRNVGYTTNKWYIEGRTVTNDGDKFTMELDLNPFASPLLDYRDNKDKYIKDYKDALKQLENQQENAAKNESKNNTGGEGKVIDDLVKKIVGKEKNELKKAKKIHSWLVNNVRYKYYTCSKYKTAEACLNNKGHLNCADTSRLSRALYGSANLNAYVVHAPGHFWTVIKINGKEYNSDATSRSRPWNKVYKNKKYTSKNGKNPSC